MLIGKSRRTGRIVYIKIAANSSLRIPVPSELHQSLRLGVTPELGAPCLKNPNPRDTPHPRVSPHPS